MAGSGWPRRDAWWNRPGAPGRAAASARTRTRAKSRNSDSSRLSRSDSRMTRRASVCSSVPENGERASCSTALRIDASGFLISCASDAESSATPSRRSARSAQRLHALLVGDVLEDRRGRAVGAQAVAVGVGRRDADRQRASRPRRSIPSPRVVRTRSRTERSSASPSSGAMRAELARAPACPCSRLEVDAEQLLGHRVGVEQPSGLRRS